MSPENTPHAQGPPSLILPGCRIFSSNCQRPRSQSFPHPQHKLNAHQAPSWNTMMGPKVSCSHRCGKVEMKVLVPQSCPSLCNPIGLSKAPSQAQGQHLPSLGEQGTAQWGGKYQAEGEEC